MVCGDFLFKSSALAQVWTNNLTRSKLKIPENCQSRAVAWREFRHTKKSAELSQMCSDNSSLSRVLKVNGATRVKRKVADTSYTSDPDCFDLPEFAGKTLRHCYILRPEKNALELRSELVKTE